MPQFTAKGIVPEFQNDEFSLSVENDLDLLKFWEEESIDTKLDFRGEGEQKNPKIQIRGSFAGQSKPGDIIEYTFETQIRSNGSKGIRGERIKRFDF